MTTPSREQLERRAAAGLRELLYAAAQEDFDATGLQTELERIIQDIVEAALAAARTEPGKGEP